jgi:hypothetical protein
MKIIKSDPLPVLPPNPKFGFGGRGTAVLMKTKILLITQLPNYYLLITNKVNHGNLKLHQQPMDKTKRQRIF